MAEFRKIVQCPNCRFTNRLGDKRCIICKAELPETIGAAAPPAPEHRGPSSASNAAAAARAASGKASGGVKKPEEVTNKTKRDAVTTIRPALDDSLLSAAAPKAEEPPPPKPLTKRVQRPGAAATADAVAWLLCDPLPAIPLLSGKSVIVGRQDTCDLVLPHKEVSRQHGVFKVTGKQITLEDQGSSNGCYVNGKRCANQVVKVGDTITIGPYEIEVKASAEDTTDEGHSETKSFDITRINSSGPGASMAGKLSDVPLVEILQGIEFNRKTCTLSISDGKLKGKIIFGEGRPMTASFGAERDMDAVRAMLALRDGRFVLSNEIEACEPTLNLTVTALLLESSRVIDESTLPPDAPPPMPEVEPASSEAPPADAYGSEAPAPEAYDINPELAKTAEAENPVDAPPEG